MVKRKGKSRGFAGLPALDITADSPEDMKDLFIQYVIESGVLADEPEFVDFRFDPDQAYASAENTDKKYARALRKAEGKGGDELELLRDDMRIEAIERLLTPPIRQDILIRLDRLVLRLKNREADFNKTLMAAAVQTLFDMGEFPWGMTSLMMVLFSRSLDAVMPSEDELQFAAQLESIFPGEDGSVEDLWEKLDDPQFIEGLGAKIDTGSELYKNIEKLSDKISSEFIDAVWQGDISLDVFREEEILSYFELLQERFEAAGLSVSDAGSSEVGELVLATIGDHVETIVTSQRLKVIEQDLRSTLKTWMKDGNKFAGPLAAEIHQLDLGTPLLKGLFVSQMQRYAEEIRAAESEPIKKTKRRRRGRRRSRSKRASS